MDQPNGSTKGINQTDGSCEGPGGGGAAAWVGACGPYAIIPIPARILLDMWLVRSRMSMSSISEHYIDSLSSSSSCFSSAASSACHFFGRHLHAGIEHHPIFMVVEGLVFWGNWYSMILYLRSQGMHAMINPGSLSRLACMACLLCSASVSSFHTMFLQFKHNFAPSGGSQLNGRVAYGTLNEHPPAHLQQKLLM